MAATIDRSFARTSAVGASVARRTAEAAPAAPAVKQQGVAAPQQARAASGVSSFETTHTAKAGGVAGALLGLVGRKPDTAYDGHFVGADGRTFGPDTPMSQVPAVKPSQGEPKGTVLYVNGIMTPKDSQLAEMRSIADSTGMQVVGIHNSTQGPVTDLAQCLGDKLDKGKNPAVDTLANTLYKELKAGRPVHLMGYSQGGLITARALNDVKQRLQVEDGMSKAQAEKLMSNLKVETFGAASTTYPDGPKYVHYVNRLDPVPTLFGLGSDLNPLDDFITHAGKDAKVHYFNQGGLNLIGNHLLAQSYLNNRVPFDQAREGDFSR